MINVAIALTIVVGLAYQRFATPIIICLTDAYPTHALFDQRVPSRQEAFESRIVHGVKLAAKDIALGRYASILPEPDGRKPSSVIHKKPSSLNAHFVVEVTTGNRRSDLQIALAICFDQRVVGIIDATNGWSTKPHLGLLKSNGLAVVRCRPDVLELADEEECLSIFPTASKENDLLVGYLKANTFKSFRIAYPENASEARMNDLVRKLRSSGLAGNIQGFSRIPARSTNELAFCEYTQKCAEEAVTHHVDLIIAFLDCSEAPTFLRALSARAALFKKEGKEPSKLTVLFAQESLDPQLSLASDLRLFVDPYQVLADYDPVLAAEAINDSIGSAGNEEMWKDLGIERYSYDACVAIALNAIQSKPNGAFSRLFASVEGLLISRRGSHISGGSLLEKDNIFLGLGGAYNFSNSPSTSRLRISPIR